MTISSRPSTVTGKSEGLTNLERGNEPSPIPGKGSATERQWKQAPTPIHKVRKF